MRVRLGFGVVGLSGAAASGVTTLMAAMAGAIAVAPGVGTGLSFMSRPLVRLAALVFTLGVVGSWSRGASAQLAATGKVCTQDGMPCRLWEPVGYQAGTAYPLILYLHSAGDSGSNNTSQVDGWGSLPPLILTDAARAKYPAFFLAPQAAAAEGDDRWVNWDWTKGSYDVDAVPESRSMGKAMAILDTIRKTYNIDPDRIYVMGESMGGFGTWDALARHPELFAAGVPTDGGGSPKAAPRLRNTAVLAAHYSKDGSVPVSSDREMFLALTKAGGRPTLVEIDKQSHGIAGKVAGNPQFLEWLFAQRRGVVGVGTVSQISVTPQGGASAGAAQVMVRSGLGGAQLRYTLDGSFPTAGSAAATGTVSVGASALFVGAALLNNDDGDVFAYQAAPFVIDGKPLPNGAELGGTGGTPSGGTGGGAPTAGQSGGGGTGGSATTGGSGGAGGKGGSSTGGSMGGSAGGSRGGASAGSSGGTGAGGASSGSGGGAGSGGAAGGAGGAGGGKSGGSGGSGARAGGSGSGGSSDPDSGNKPVSGAGCAMAGQDHALSSGWLLLALILIPYARRRRADAKRQAALR